MAKKDIKKRNSRAKAQVSKNNRKIDENSNRMKDEIFAILLLGLGVFLAISMHTEWAGAIGGLISQLFKGLFGLGSFILPYMLIIYSILIFAKVTKPLNLKVTILIGIIFLTIDIINAERFVESIEINQYNFKDIYNYSVKLESGGIIGSYLAKGIVSLIGKAGLYLVSVIILLISIMLTLNKPYSKVKEDSKKKLDTITEERRKRREERETAQNEGYTSDELYEKSPVKARKKSSKSNIMDIAKNDENYGVSDENKDKKFSPEYITYRDNPYDIANRDNNENAANFIEDISIGKDNPVLNENDIVNEKEIDETATLEKTSKNKSSKKDIEEVSIDISEDYSKQASTYKLPPLSLLNMSKTSTSKSDDRSELTNNIAVLENTLNSFNVDARVINVTKGSSITRYEIQPAIGVKVSKIVNLADDIALNLRAKSIRIEAPIPGKAAVGIEVENNVREMVTARDIIGSSAFTQNKSELAFAVGKDISGTPVIADLAKMPHMLIAGATGAGKSVCINTIISSILYRATPDQVKLILIDPKMVELGNYNGIPHLLIPVVTDSNKAAAALNWAVSEMMQRYKKFTSKGVKDIKSYNSIVEKEEDGITLPKIVIIIDELADLMMVASSQVEQAIARLAQLARAAGMHLIVATQRPSVDVVTGLIKANIPSRISFMVSSQVDSRTILDMAGAEKLVGNGDMLFKAQDMDKPMRIQGPFISDEEVHKIIEFVKNQGSEEEYDTEVISKIDSGKIDRSSEDGDELLEDAIELVLGAEQASVSMLQRRFRIGYNRAARIVDQMEEMGIIGKQDGSKPRSVNMSLEEYLASKNVEE